MKTRKLLFSSFLSLAALIPALLPAQSQNSAPPNSAAEYINKDSFPTLVGSLKNDQIEKISRLIKSHNQLESLNRKQIDQINQDIAASFLDPEVKAETVYALQDKIDKLLSQIDQDKVKTIMGIRQTLNPQQREILAYGDPAVNFPGAELSPEQWNAYKELKRKFLSKQQDLKDKLANLEYDSRLLFQHLHLNETELLAKQEEINKINNEIESNKIRLAVASRKILSPQQNMKVFNRHHPKIWEDTGINSKQDDDIMAVHMKIEAADQEGRRSVIQGKNKLARVYLDPLPDENAAASATSEIDQALSKVWHKQLGLILEGRSHLNSIQKRRLVGLMKAPIEPGPGNQLVPPEKNPTIVGKNMGEFLTDFSVVKYLPGSSIFVKEPDTILLNSGKALVSARQATKVKADPYNITLAPDTVALIQKSKDAITVINLHDPKAHALSLRYSGKNIDLIPGAECVIASNQDSLNKHMASFPVGRRKQKTDRIGPSYVAHADVSIVTIMQNDNLVHRMLANHNPDDKQLVDKIMNMAAAISQSTKNRGQYSQTPAR